MNKELKQAFRQNSWSRLEGFLAYLRNKECFEGLGGQKNANPYWYGTILDFNKARDETRAILDAKDIEETDLKEILDMAERDLNSPIVRLVGIFLKRTLFNR